MAVNYKQENRLIHITDIGLGKDKLLATHFSGTESISSLYSFEVTVLSSNLEIEPDKVVGKDATVTIQDKNERYFHGYISQFVFGEIIADNLRQYRFTLVPWLWFLRKTNDHRIFQNKNTKQIVTDILSDYGFSDFEFQTDGGAEREYCVQHNESDFDFISRLLAEDGLSYYFKHEKTKHQLIFVDSNHTYDTCKDNQLIYSHGTKTEAQINQWVRQHNFRKGVWTLNDYDFQSPDKDLIANIKTLSKFNDNGSFEHYEYPGLYASSLGQTLVKKRMEAEESQRQRVDCKSGYSSLYAGGRFTLAKHTHDSELGDYVITSINHTATDQTHVNQSESSQYGYHNEFRCLPNKIKIYPAPRPRPTMRGPQTAIVVGPAGEEVYLDEFGRIKVQFIWDREGKKNEYSTCFLRVAQIWAGMKWGAHFIPRIGHEVIVDFYDGDPDRPFVSGSVYNGKNRPPYVSKSLSGIKSHSTKGGTAQNFNELRFDDKKGSEQIFIRAEKDQDIMVRNDRREHIFKDRHKTVENDQYEITKRDHHTVIGKDRLEEVQNSSFLRVARDYVIRIGQNMMRVVNGGEMHKTIGSRTREVLGSEGIEIKGAQSVKTGKEIFHKSPKIVYQGEKEITIKGPGGFIKIDSGGVTIVGKKVKINEGGSAGAGELVPSSDPNEPDQPRVADPAVDGR